MTTRKGTSQEANSRVPEAVTQLFIDKILSLEQSPRVEYLREQILSKFVSSETDPPIVRRNRAIFKWLATERNNEATNDRLLTVDEDYQILPRTTWQSFVSFAQSLIVDIIGEVPPTDCLIGQFSGGASTSRKRTESHPALKYLGEADVTESCLAYFQEVIPEVPGWLSSEPISLRVVRGNILFTVPKKTDIDRCACKEPDINMFIQKGVGSFIRSSLRRQGINLNDQSINRNLARLGSVDASLATLDLSSASDSVSTELVALMLPPLWYSLLNAIRCPITIIDGDEHPNEMFSSMGNGFTFELESLLFYVLARTSAYFRGVPGVISVYGDDLIVPTALAHDLIDVLLFMGFETNVKKSHITGYFRESCGGHYLNGRDITPFYLREPIKRVSDVIHMANSLRKWSDELNIGILNCDVWPIWSWLRDLVPSRLWGGRDYNFKFALVTPHNPRGYLHEKVKRRSTSDGGYYHWLNITWNRGLPGDIQTSLRSVVTHDYRVKPNRVVNSNIALFLEEL
jgi:hypothetical protein